MSPGSERRAYRIFGAMMLLFVVLGFITGWHSARTYYTGGQFSGSSCRNVICTR